VGENKTKVQKQKLDDDRTQMTRIKQINARYHHERAADPPSGGHHQDHHANDTNATAKKFEIPHVVWNDWL
jgi:hypothetical protein